VFNHGLIHEVIVTDGVAHGWIEDLFFNLSVQRQCCADLISNFLFADL
jgi:hypothetical protein